MALGTKIYLVIYNQQASGGATAGFKWENEGEKGGGAEIRAKNFTDPQNARVLKVNANSAQAACTGVRKAYGEGLIETKMLVAEIESAPGTVVNTFEELVA